MADIENTTLGRGDLFFKPVGQSGYDFIGNSESFGVTISTEYLKHYNSGRGIKVQDKEIPVQTDYAGTYVTDNVTPKNLEKMFQGDAATVAVAGSVGETISFADVAHQGRYVLPGRQVTNVVVEVSSVAQTVDTDYTVDLERGIIVILSEGAIVEGVTIDVTYDIVAHSYNRTRSGAAPVKGSLMFIAYNPEGEKIDYLIEDCSLSPNGEFQIKADEWQKLPFNVAISTPDGGYAILANGEPFTP